MNELISATVGIVIGVILEDPLTKLRDGFVKRMRGLFRKRRQNQETGTLFRFGNIATTWLVIDGDGREDYSPKTIITHFDNNEVKLPEELVKRKKAIEKEQEEKRKKKESFIWNGENYYLDRYAVQRGGLGEELQLEMWFRPSDYYTFLATNLSLADETLRKTYIPEIITQPPKYFGTSFGINIAVITQDNYIIFPRRSKNVSTNKEMYVISMSEGVSRALDRKTANQAPDMYRTAIRGLAEELGIFDITPEEIVFLSYGVDTKYIKFSLLGLVKVEKTAGEIEEWRSQGVKDKWESDEFHVVKFDVHHVLEFVFSHTPWSPESLATLYHTLIHEFGRGAVEKAIQKYLQ